MGPGYLWVRGGVLQALFEHLDRLGDVVALGQEQAVTEQGQTLVPLVGVGYPFQVPKFRFGRNRGGLRTPLECCIASK